MGVSDTQIYPCNESLDLYEILDLSLYQLNFQEDLCTHTHMQSKCAHMCLWVFSQNFMFFSGVLLLRVVSKQNMECTIKKFIHGLKTLYFA